MEIDYEAIKNGDVDMHRLCCCNNLLSECKKYCKRVNKCLSAAIAEDMLKAVTPRKVLIRRRKCV